MAYFIARTFAKFFHPFFDFFLEQNAVFSRGWWRIALTLTSAFPYAVAQAQEIVVLLWRELQDIGMVFANNKKELAAMQTPSDCYCY